MKKREQNTSTAVMQRRVKKPEDFDPFDYYPTPPWATRAFCEFLNGALGVSTGICSVDEPACGAGDMANTLAEYFGQVRASDIVDRGYGERRDYLWPSDLPQVDWTITNPPFKLALQFIETALKRSRFGVAMLVRSAFLESETRYTRLFSKHPPAAVVQYVERVVMHQGRLVKDGTTATAYCWVVWTHSDVEAPRFYWIPPCRARLERDEDYRSGDIIGRREQLGLLEGGQK
jgi:hypothetical protein